MFDTTHRKGRVMNRARLSFALLFVGIAVSGPGSASELTASKDEDKSENGVVVAVSSRAPSPREARLSADFQSTICWRGEDQDYELRFAASQWSFREAPDRDDTNGDRIILVPKGSCSRNFTLGYDLKPGHTRRHHYRVANPGEVAPTNGPVVIGEG